MSEVRRLNMANLKNILLYSNASLIRQKGHDGFGCILCAGVFPSAVELKGHFIEEHSNRETINNLPNKAFENTAKLDVSFLNCAICNKDMVSLEQLVLHLGDYHDVEMYNGIVNTLLPFKFEREGLNCALCDAKHSSFKVLIEHMNNHFRNYVCEVCDAGFVSSNIYRAHVLRHGTGETFNCAQCDGIFNTQVKLTDHMNRVHLGIKRNVCDFCLERFPDYHKKVKHMQAAHRYELDKHSCKACSLDFDSQRALQFHIKKDHLLERNHVCSECGKSFFLKNQLTEHALSHKRDQLFPCTVAGCQKIYTRKKILKMHLRSAHSDQAETAMEEIIALNLESSN